MRFIPDFSEAGKIIPKGDFKVVFDGKVLGSFGTLQEAQNFQSTLGRPGSRIITPNLRKDMTEDQIGKAQKTLDDWGKNDAWTKKG